ncbi:MAG: flagellar basal body rod protein FlgB [Verrucomicrobiota bacterium]
MMGSIGSMISDKTLQTMELALDARMARHQAIASNISNVNTPGYKRLDISKTFEAEYKSALQQIENGAVIEDRPTPALATSSIHGKTRLDGNNVNMEQEVLELSKNLLEYEFANQILQSKFSGLKKAIGGSGGG